MTTTELIAELEKHPVNTELEILVQGYKDGVWNETHTYLINTDEPFYLRKFEDETALQIICGAVEISV